MENMDTHSNKIGADKLAENTSNAPEIFAQIVCPSPKIWSFDEKKPSLGVRSTNFLT